MGFAKVFTVYAKTYTLLETGNYIHSGNTTQIYTDRVMVQPQSHAHGVHVVYIVALSLNIAAVWIFFSFQGLITRSAWTVSTPRWSHVFSLWYGPWKSLQLGSEMPITDLRKIKIRVRQKFVNNR